MLHRDCECPLTEKSFQKQPFRNPQQTRHSSRAECGPKADIQRFNYIVPMKISPGAVVHQLLDKHVTRHGHRHGCRPILGDAEAV